MITLNPIGSYILGLIFSAAIGAIVGIITILILLILDIYFGIEVSFWAYTTVFAAVSLFTAYTFFKKGANQQVRMGHIGLFLFFDQIVARSEKEGNYWWLPREFLSSGIHGNQVPYKESSFKIVFDKNNPLTGKNGEKWEYAEYTISFKVNNFEEWVKYANPINELIKPLVESKIREVFGRFPLTPEHSATLQQIMHEESVIDALIYRINEEIVNKYSGIVSIVMIKQENIEAPEEIVATKEEAQAQQIAHIMQILVNAGMNAEIAQQVAPAIVLGYEINSVNIAGFEGVIQQLQNMLKPNRHN